jgi:hypothetical protein
MPINTIDEALATPDLELIKASLGEIQRSPRQIMLSSVLEMRWSMKNQENTAQASKDTAELVNQTKGLATQTMNLVTQTRNLAIATWGIALITLLTQIALIILTLKGGK